MRVRAAAAGLLMLLLHGCSSGAQGMPPAGPQFSAALIAPECGGDFDIEDRYLFVADGAGEDVAVGKTSSNLFVDKKDPCVVTFETFYREAADSYTLLIGDHRGPTWSAEELEDANWWVNGALGDVKMRSASETEVCEALLELNRLLFHWPREGPRVVRWDRGVMSAIDVTKSFAIGVALAGELDSRDLVALLHAERGLMQAEWATKPQLEQAVEQVNKPARSVTRRYGCPRVWKGVDVR